MKNSNTNKQSKASDFWVTALALASLCTIVVFILSTLGNFFENFYNNDKKKAFAKNTQFICRLSYMRNKAFHHVSKQDGWVIYKEYFKKEDLLFEINSCQEDE